MRFFFDSRNRAGSGMLVRALGLWSVLLLGITPSASAQDPALQTHVCANDSQTDANLVDALVVANVEGFDRAFGRTGPDGCVTLLLPLALGTNVEDEIPSSSDLDVAPSFPQPARDRVTIPVHVGAPQQVTLYLYDVLGRSVLSPFHVYAQTGQHAIEIDASGLNAGLYLYQLAGQNVVRSGQIIKSTAAAGGQVAAHWGSYAGPEWTPRPASAAGASGPAVPRLNGSIVHFEAQTEGYRRADVVRDVINGQVIDIPMQVLEFGVPSSPPLLEPVNGTTGLDADAITLTWSSNADAILYTVQVSSQSDFSSVEVQKEDLTATSHSISGLEKATQYYWRVRATGSAGTGDWSVANTFTTESTSPVLGAPQLIAPADGANDVYPEGMVLEWAEVDSAENYTVQIASDPNFFTIVFQQSGIIPPTASPPSLAHEATYYWRVLALTNNVPGDWSVPFSFTTLSSSVAPGTPATSSPADGAAGIDPNNAVLTWTQAFAAGSYQVQLGAGADFSNILADVEGVAGTTYAASGLPESTQIFWRVRGVNSNGSGDWSDTSRFTTTSASSLPAVPSLAAPVDGATNIAFTNTNLTWNVATNATAYDLQVSTNSQFSSLVVQENDITSTNRTVTGLAASTTYHWRVRASNSNGSSNWSTSFQFSTAASGSTNQMIALDLMGPGDTYYGLPGGLVDNGEPEVTPTNGKIVVIAISMSNGYQEFNKFENLYENHPDVANEVHFVNCAVGGNALERWLSSEDLWNGCRNKVNQSGHSVDQVKVVWAKNANMDTAHGLTLPNPGADYYQLVENIGGISVRIGQEFPSVQAVFHSSRIWGGYVEEKKMAARGEPISYEGGYATNTVIQQYKNGELNGSPWIGWGPYIWANGTTPNGSGLYWERADYQGANGENQHPSDQGSTKVANALHNHFMKFDWYRK